MVIIAIPEPVVHLERVGQVDVIPATGVHGILGQVGAEGYAGQAREGDGGEALRGVGSLGVELVDDVGQARLGLVHAHEAARGVRIVGCSDGAEVQHVVGACAHQ